MPKITKRQLKRLIAEEIAVVNQETIEDTVLNVLSDEGGAAGLDPIEAALEDLEDDDISLPEESIEDLISGVAGVKRHADGDYVDTTQLEGTFKITRGQLQRIIAEERAKILAEQMTPDAEIMNRLRDGLISIALDRIVNQGDNILESEVLQFVMDTSAADSDRVYDAMEMLAAQLNLM